jgi:hypothetical protein
MKYELLIKLLMGVIRVNCGMVPFADLGNNKP